MWWRWVPLHGPHRVSVVRRDMVGLSFDIKQYIHIFSEGILRRVHITVAEPRVVGVGMLPVNYRRVMMAHPPGLIRAYFHRFLANVHTHWREPKRHKEGKKISVPKIPASLNPQASVDRRYTFDHLEFNKTHTFTVRSVDLCHSLLLFTLTTTIKITIKAHQSMQ